jgi:hypothetical protein
MIDLLLNGFVHVSVILLLSLSTLVQAVSFAVRPGERKLGVLRPLSLATTFSVLSATCAGIGASLKFAADLPAGESVVSVLVAGLAESMVPGVFAFAVLAISWALAAVGFTRQHG